MNALKLLGWEIERVKKPYLILIGCLLFIQFSWLGYFLWNRTKAYETGQSTSLISFLDYLNGLIFNLSIGLAAIVLMLYSVWIWYQDFQGRGTFMMRLLTLPQHRLHLFFAKLATVMLLVLGLFAIQWGALHVEYILFTSWFDSRFIPMTGTFEMALLFHELLALIYPPSLFNFLVHLAVIVFVVITLFSFVLLERGLWQRTIWSPVLAFIAIGAVLITPIVIFAMTERYLLLDEQLLLVTSEFIVWTLFVFFVSRRLLIKRMSV